MIGKRKTPQCKLYIEVFVTFRRSFVDFKRPRSVSRRAKRALKSAYWFVLIFDGTKVGINVLNNQIPETQDLGEAYPHLCHVYAISSSET